MENGWVLREEGEELRKAGRDGREKGDPDTGIISTESSESLVGLGTVILYDRHQVKGGITKRKDEMKARLDCTGLCILCQDV